MNDRFKFKVYSTINQNYIDEERLKYFFIGADGGLYLQRNDGSILPISQEQFVVKASTGLRDKNGKLIYEGDIVITHYAGEPTGQTYIYRWKDPTFYVEPFEKGKPSGIHYYYFAVANERCEIIGNVHENPELLESEER